MPPDVKPAAPPTAPLPTPAPAPTTAFPWRGWALINQQWVSGVVMGPAAPVGSGGTEGVFTFASDDGTFAMPSVKDVRHGAKPADLPQLYATGATGGKRHQLVIRTDKALVVTAGGRILGRYSGDEDGLKLAKAHFAKLEPELAAKMAGEATAKSA
jgi:hypothetical protein